MDWHDLINPEFLVQTVGLFGIIAIIFAESGFFFGVIFPGDSLLFAAGLLASQGLLPIVPLVIGCILAAIIGDQVGYWTGKKLGPKIFRKEESFFFNKKHLVRSQKYFETHGPSTILLARFIPIVRTFAPMLAGVGSMKFSTFLKWNIGGGIFWVLLMTLLGYFLGTIIPNVDRYILPVTVGILVLSFIPIFWKARRKSGEVVEEK